jgi:hypothetical protein
LIFFILLLLFNPLGLFGLEFDLIRVELLKSPCGGSGPLFAHSKARPADLFHIRGGVRLEAAVQLGLFGFEELGEVLKLLPLL